MVLVGTPRICQLKTLFCTEKCEAWNHLCDLTDFLYQWDYASSYIYLISLFGYKFTLLLLYLRLFGINDNFRYATWAVMFFTFGYLFSNFLTQIFGCIPIKSIWYAVPAHCIDRTKAGLAFGSMNFISDLFIFILPLPMVWRLQLSPKGKLGVMLVFMGGGM